MPWGASPFRPHPRAPPEEHGLLGALRAQQGVGMGGTFPLGSICLPYCLSLGLEP